MEPNFIIHPTKLTPIYWDHDQNTLPTSLGMTPRRHRELERGLEDLFNPAGEEKPHWKCPSAQIEAALNLAGNEQERIYLAFTMGGHAAKTSLMQAMPGIKEMLRGRDDSEE